jgi:t-SNARE complex subunit (syntaxin)
MHPNQVYIASVKQMQAQAAEERIKKNTHASLVQQFVEIMQHYQSAQAKYKQQYQDNVRRQILVGTCLCSVNAACK